MEYPSEEELQTVLTFVANSLDGMAEQMRRDWEGCRKALREAPKLAS